MSDNDPKTNDDSGRLGRFIQTYSGFLSSFVIGMAGLVATSIWQYRQSVNAERQADSEQKIAARKAENDWRIARAEILAKNLDVLSAQGTVSADQRYGVLLSLTRGNILDPELAVSYAVELGKDNPSYMRSVLESTSQKNYVQLAQAFTLTCLQRFGVERAAEICTGDRLAERSDAIAQLIKDEASRAAGGPADETRRGPLSLLTSEDDVQATPTKLAWLFEPYLQDLYEHRRWKEIERFETHSSGARLTSALVLATARTGELLSAVESRQLDAFHSQRRKWLIGYLFGRGCDADCRSRLVEFMLSTVRESDGEYDEALKELLLRARSDAGRAVNHIHARLLWCQIDPEDLDLLRDRILVPALNEALTQPRPEIKRDATIVEDLVGLLALAPPPTTGAALAAYKQVDAAVRANDRLGKLLSSRTARVRAQRADAPPMLRRMNFCSAAAIDSHATGF